MVYNSDIHHRRSIRVVGYDYSRSGAYFITICTHNRECIFAAIPNSERIYVILADRVPLMELDLNEKSRVSASENFEFGIAGIFGEIVDRAMNYNKLGNIARSLRDDKSFALAEFSNTSSEYRNRRIVRGAYRR
jgi:hypothetical protein